MCVFSFLRHLKGQREKNEIPNLLDKGPPTESLFCFCFFSSHATSWHKANSPDAAPYRSSTDFSVFPLHHFVAQSRSPRHTAQLVSDRFFFLTPPRGTFCFSFVFFFYTTSWHIFLFFCLHHLVAQSRSFRGIAKMVHNDYEAR